MSNKMVLFAIGPDRPGLVSEITSVIHGEGGNLEDSRMASLAGDFALIVLFSGDDATIANIQKKCREMESRLNISTQFKPASEKTRQEDSTSHIFEATGLDQPGIVSCLSAVFATNGANVISMETSLFNLAFAGTPMFKVTGEILIPKSVSTSGVRDSLEDACHEMDLVLDFS